MLSTLVTGGLAFTSLVALADSPVEAPHEATGETQIEIPSSELEIFIKDYMPTSFEEIKKEGERLQAEREEEQLRVELEKAKQAEEARIKAERIEKERLAKIEAERQAKIEAERKAKAQAEAKRQAEIQAKEAKQTQSTEGIAFNGSYYTSHCNGCSGVTATGYNVSNTIYYQGMRVIAVDPRVIPLYSIVEVSTPHETFKAIALDKGGAIKGHNVDILVADNKTAYKLGRHTVYIKVLKNGN